MFKGPQGMSLAGNAAVASAAEASAAEATAALPVSDIPWGLFNIDRTPKVLNFIQCFLELIGGEGGGGGVDFVGWS